MIGKTISHYQILEKLGEGGMGVVYKAPDMHLDRYAAIKVLPAKKVTDQGHMRRFVQEAKAASALNHPNIITLYDIDQADGADFIAMEYVSGKTLGQLIPRKGLRLHEALRYSIQIADLPGDGPRRRYRSPGPETLQCHDHGEETRQVARLRFGQAH